MSSPTQDGIRELIQKGEVRNPRTRQRIDRGFNFACICITSLAVLALAVLITSIFVRGSSSISWQFLTGETSSYAETASIKVSLWGSIWVCAICALVALPIGVSTAIYLEEFAKKNRLTRFIQINISNLAGVPSIVYGLLGLTLFVRMFGLGSPNQPIYEIGGTPYAIYYDEIGEPLRVPVSEMNQPPTLTSGLTAYTERVVETPDGDLEFTGDWIPVNLTVGSEGEDMPEESGAIQYATSIAPPDDYEMVKSWYYMQIPFGQSVLAGGLTLMLVILPVVIIASQEALRAIPPSLRSGSLAMGATKWQTVSRITLPASIPTIMTGAILAMSRAIGEAAPILVLGVALMLTEVPQNVMDLFTVLPLQIYNWTSRAQEEFRALAAGGIIVLLGVLLVFNAIAVSIRYKTQKPLQ